MPLDKIILKVSRDNFYKMYTRMFMSFLGITKKEAFVLAEIMRIGALVTSRDDKNAIMERTKMGSKEFSQYMYKLRKKGVLKDKRYDIEVHEKVYTDIKDLCISVDFRVTDQ